MKRSSLKRKKRLNPVSARRALENVSYIIAKEQWREKRIALDGFRCQVTIDEDLGRCWNRAMDSPHHRKRRGKYLTQSRYFLAACFGCHNYIENNKRWARSKGYILYK